MLDCQKHLWLDPIINLKTETMLNFQNPRMCFYIRANFRQVQLVWAGQEEHKDKKRRKTRQKEREQEMKAERVQ